MQDIQGAGRDSESDEVMTSGSSTGTKEMSHKQTATRKTRGTRERRVRKERGGWIAPSPGGCKNRTARRKWRQGEAVAGYRLWQFAACRPKLRIKLWGSGPHTNLLDPRCFSTRLRRFLPSRASRGASQAVTQRP